MRKFGWRQVLALATDILPKIPTRDDGVIMTAVKLLGIADSFTKVAKGQSAALHDFFSNLDLVEGNNQQLVNTFFKTPLKDHFNVRHITMGDYLDIVVASKQGIGEIYFLEWHYGGHPEYSSSFWYTPGFRFDSALEVLWTKFKGRIHVGFSFDSSRSELQLGYSEIPESSDPILGKLKDDLEEFRTQHLKYSQDSVPRTYLFAGKPGCGKTSFALELAKLIKGRILRIDANGITGVSTRDLDLLIQSLAPDFLVIDDLDRCSELEKALPTLFSTLADFKGKFPNVTICITINDITKLDAALLRPGRIDEIYEFGVPNEADRKVILEGYLKEFGIAFDDITDVVACTDGLTAGYLKEVALQLRYRPREKVLKVVSRMCELAQTKTPEVKKENLSVLNLGSP